MTASFTSASHDARREPRGFLRDLVGVCAALLMLVPCALVRAGDGVGVDGLIGSLPQRRGPNGECFFNGLAASFVPGNGTFWGHLPTASNLLVFEGDENAIRSGVVLVRRDTGRVRVPINDTVVAYSLGCDVDASVDFQRLASAGVNTYIQLPSSYTLTTASAASSNGIILSAPVAAFARHYYVNLNFVAWMMGQLWLPDVELYFADPSGQVIRARLSLEPGSLLRIQVF